MDSHLPFSFIQLFILILGVPYFAYNLFCFRNVRVIRARNFPLILLCCIVTMLWLIVMLLRSIVDPTEYQCLWSVVSNTCFLCPAMLVYYIRLLDLTAALRMNYDKMLVTSRGRKEQEADYSPSFFTRNRWIRSKYFLSTVFIVLESTIICCIYIDFEGVVGAQPISTCSRFLDLLGIFMVCIWLVLVIATYLFARGYSERFYIKLELAWTAGCAVSGISLWVLIRNINFISDWRQSNYRYLENQVLTLCIFPVFYFMLVYPLREADKYKAKTMCLSREFSFRELLKHPIFYSAFRLFLVEEWAVENIFFLQDVDDIEEKVNAVISENEQNQNPNISSKPLLSDSDNYTKFDNGIFLEQMLVDFVDIFLSEGCLLEVNIGYKKQSMLHSQLKEILAKHTTKEYELALAVKDCPLLTSTKNEVFRLLEGGTFVRFICSPAFSAIEKDIDISQDTRGTSTRLFERMDRRTRSHLVEVQTSSIFTEEIT